MLNTVIQLGPAFIPRLSPIEVHANVFPPDDDLGSSRAGFRWRSMLGGVEYTLNYLYGHTTSAYTYFDGTTNTTRIFQLQTFAPPPFPAIVNVPAAVPGDMYFSRRHKIMHMMGSSFNKTFLNPGPLQGFTLRGEFVYFRKEPTYYGIDTYRAATRRSDKWAYVLGLDKTYFTNWLFSLQFAQFIIEQDEWTGTDDLNMVGQRTYDALDSTTYGLQDKIENYITLKVATDYMHERIKPEILIIYQDDNAGKVSPKVNFEARDNLWFGLGYHHFYGKPAQSNGQFRNNDQAFFDVTYTF